MSLNERVKLYKKLEEKRSRPLLVYVTSSRRNAEGFVARDAISEVLAQLQSLPTEAKELDLLLVSNGGDPTVAWRIVSLIRERVKKFAVLVPQAAFSAATLIALGADEIVMHSYGNLGPTDPQITNKSKNVQFGSEDLAAFLKFAREEVGLTDQAPLLELFKQFSSEVGFVGIGVAARSAQLSARMAEKLLRLHMTSDNQLQKAKVISEALNTKYFHHGYPVNRTEAKEIGLPVATSDPQVEGLMWSIWLDIEEELKLREPFSPLRILKDDPACVSLFGTPSPAPPASHVPPGSILPVFVPPADYSTVGGLMESRRWASRSVIQGSVFAVRLPDLSIKYSLVTHKEGWASVPVPADDAEKSPNQTSMKKPKKK